MISRLTDTSEENDRRTVPADRLVEISTHDEGRLSDVPPMGYAGASFYPEDGLLILSYRKYGETYADPADDENDVEYADTGLGFLTVERVVELVQVAIQIAGDESTPDGMLATDAEAWVLEKIRRG
jgi:hypothetical protein